MVGELVSELVCGLVSELGSELVSELVSELGSELVSGLVSELVNGLLGYSSLGSISAQFDDGMLMTTRGISYEKLVIP